MGLRYAADYVLGDTDFILQNFTLRQLEGQGWNRPAGVAGWGFEQVNLLDDKLPDPHSLVQDIGIDLANEGGLDRGAGYLLEQLPGFQLESNTWGFGSSIAGDEQEE